MLIMKEYLYDKGERLFFKLKNCWGPWERTWKAMCCFYTHTKAMTPTENDNNLAHPVAHVCKALLCCFRSKTPGVERGGWKPEYSELYKSQLTQGLQGQAFCIPWTNLIYLTTIWDGCYFIFLLRKLRLRNI